MAAATVPAKINGSLFGSLANLNTEPVGGMATIETNGGGVPYVAFLTRKSKVYADVVNAIPGIQEGSTYFSDPAKGFIGLQDGCKIIYLDSFQCWVRRNDKNEAIGVKLEKPTDRDSPFREHIEAMVLVQVGDTFRPASMSFTSARVRAITSAIAAVKKAAEPEWGQTSPEHQASLQIPVPKFRVVTNITSWMGTAKSSGFAMISAAGKPRPITAGEATLLQKSTSAPTFTTEMDSVRDAFMYRVNELKSQAGK